MGNPGTDRTFTENFPPPPHHTYIARIARIVALGIPHHVTQRGNARQVIFETDGDRQTYLDLLRQNCQRQSLSLVGYFLMSNHVHLIVIPHRVAALALTLQEAHGRFATYFNATRAVSGHVWQGRYFSCPLDTAHLWAALRYTELNPLRARMVEAPDAWRWSSARAHSLTDHADSALDMNAWSAAWDPVTWRDFLNIESDSAELDAIRRSTYTGRPLGDKGFVSDLERQLHRRLAPQKGGRPAKPVKDQTQATFPFAADSE